ncbi:MAG: response regulator [Oscillatoria sp. PMC 1051.18]|nr:response regulator [Oscillatoria sp. PMC 1050.18]MEC5030966.1 response regulator [Oscillatoria sp. PMC 1051.18]
MSNLSVVSLFSPLLKGNKASISKAESAKVLIVDDRPYSRMTVVAMLSAEDYEIIEAESGTVALEAAINSNPDLILLDLMMPQMDGIEVCRELKQNQQTQAIPVIFATVSQERRDRQIALDAGADDVLTKPLDRLQLLARMKTLIEQKRLKEDLSETERVLFEIARAIESRDSETPSREDPCAKLIAIAQGFGEFLHLSPAEIQDLMSAAHLHDIGKVGIPDSILLKKGELTAEERELVKQHVLIGEQICQPLRKLRGVLPIIRHHHERWDGSGYPDNLAGNDIPWLAQVFQMVDIYDALTRKRPYKKAYTSAQALEIISEETSNGWRNPVLADKFKLFVQTREQEENSVTRPSELSVVPQFQQSFTASRTNNLRVAFS